MLAATLIGGLAGYVVTWIVPRSVGLAAYAEFVIYWSALFLLIGTLAGIQGEVARGTRPVSTPSSQPRRARNFAVVGSIVILVVGLATAGLWTIPIFGRTEIALAVPLAFGASSFVFTAVLSGVFLGIGRWRALAAIVIIEALVRLVLVAVVLQFTNDLIVLAWAVALPVPLAMIAVWPFVRATIARRHLLDVGYGRLVRNVSQTLLAALSSAVMVSGFPLVLGLAAAAEPRTLFGMVVVTVTFTRAPLIISALSMQNLFVVMFRDEPAAFRRRFVGVLGLLALAGAVLAALGWTLGPWVFGVLFPGEPVPEGWFIAVLAGSSVLVGAMFVTAPALLARNEHAGYVIGWLVAAIATIIAVFVPLDLLARTSLALLVGPAIGLAVHGFRLARTAPLVPADR
jgi:O-antigen/teichoic acid export membrane protein